MFEGAVAAHADARGWTYDFTDGFVGQDDPEVTIALGPVAFACTEEPDYGWADIVAARLDREAGIPHELYHHAEHALADLRAALVPDERLAELPWEWSRGRWRTARASPGPGDRDHRRPAAARGRPARGGEDELFGIALEQVRTREDDPDSEPYDLPNPNGGETRIWLLNGPSAFVATHALWAEAADPPASLHGTLVAMPNRHTLLVHAILDMSALGAVNHMLALARRMHAEGPGRISEALYWLRDGALQHPPSRVSDGRLQFVPPPEFMNMLNELAADDH